MSTQFPVTDEGDTAYDRTEQVLDNYGVPPDTNFGKNFFGLLVLFICCRLLVIFCLYAQEMGADRTGKGDTRNTNIPPPPPGRNRMEAVMEAMGE
jgi:hypothetical protein